MCCFPSSPSLLILIHQRRLFLLRGTFDINHGPFFFSVRSLNGEKYMYLDVVPTTINTNTLGYTKLLNYVILLKIEEKMNEVHHQAL